MNRDMPIQFKILIGLNCLIAFFLLSILMFYMINNVVVDNGRSVGQLKLYYTISLIVVLFSIILLFRAKKAAMIIHLIYGFAMIVSGIRINPLQIIIGIIILLLIFNKTTLKYVEFIKKEPRKLHSAKKHRK